MDMPGRIWVGTSGWRYDHWIGPFYPNGTAAGAFLLFYSRYFATVEINSTFYGLPKAASLASWLADTPPDFIFACKASRYITHMKKLKDPEAGLTRFFTAIEPLGPKLGPILFQLPPRWRLNISRLEEFLQALPAHHRYAFEFRDESWLTAETFALLRKHGTALCCYDLADHQSPQEITGDFCYVRLHGPAAAYEGSYDNNALLVWAERLLTWSKTGRDCYCYFDNDEAGYAAQNADSLLKLLMDRRANVCVPQPLTRV
jgi:uncharacterized protein YecE (DUF72 family)